MLIYSGAKLGDINFVYLEVASIVVANEHGRPLEVYNAASLGNKNIWSRLEILSTDQI